MYDTIIYEATYGRTLTIKWPYAAIWPPVPHPWYRVHIFSQNMEELFFPFFDLTSDLFLTAPLAPY